MSAINFGLAATDNRQLMTELWLNFNDENDAPKRVLVEGEKFAVGRTPDNDLSIPIGNLSRRHIKIERFADIFILSDAGSSNGTTLNDANLEEPTALKDGDKLNLGGGLEINVELVSDEKKADAAAGQPDGNLPENGASASAASSAGVSASSDSSSIPLGFFILAPLIGLVLLLFVGIVFFLPGKKDSPVVKNNSDIVYTSNKDDESTTSDFPQNDDEEPDDSPTPKPTNTLTSDNSQTSETPEPVETQSTPKPIADSEKIEIASASFLRRIAFNDSKALLTGKQIAAISPKINQFKNSGALAENMKAVKANTAQLEKLASSIDMKPQLLATAVLAKLGNQRGNVVTTAQTVADVLAKLKVQNSYALADDNLIIIAAYEQGEAGKTLEMRDTVAGLMNKFPKVSPRTVRSIWFLHDNGKLSDSQYEFVLNFLAIGTITQNPKDFNVQSEAIVFN